MAKLQKNNEKEQKYAILFVTLRLKETDEQ